MESYSIMDIEAAIVDSGNSFDLKTFSSMESPLDLVISIYGNQEV